MKMRRIHLHARPDQHNGHEKKQRAWEIFTMTAGLSAEKVLTDKVVFGSVYTFHRLGGVSRSAV
jgi:hypothetical protein